MIRIKDKIIGSKVDKVIAGGGNGSIILFEFVANQNEILIFYIYCTWRLSKHGKILVGWNDNSENDNSNFVLNLKQIENTNVSFFEINELGDIEIEFDNGMKLSVFSDITSDNGLNEEDNNWSICDVNKNMCYNFTNFFEIKNENYSD